jgi:hypothetical protein
LQEWRLDSVGGGTVLNSAATRAPELHVPDADLVEKCVDEPGLDFHGLVLRDATVVLLDRPADRFGCRRPVERFESQPVVEQPWELALERVQLPEHVFSDADQNVRTGGLTLEQVGELGRKGAGLSVVREILLELVEDDVEFFGLGSRSVDERRQRVTCPHIRDDDSHARFTAQGMRNARMQHGALPDAGRTEQDRDPGGL